MWAANCDVSIGEGVVGGLVVLFVGHPGRSQWVVVGGVVREGRVAGCVWVSGAARGAEWGRGRGGSGKWSVPVGLSGVGRHGR